MPYKHHPDIGLWEVSLAGIAGYGKTLKEAFKDWEVSVAYNSIPPYSLDSYDELRKAALSNGQP
jgi:hypothetical protein